MADNRNDACVRFKQLEESTENIISHCREAGIIVCDYQPVVAFHKKINDLVEKLQVGMQVALFYEA